MNTRTFISGFALALGLAIFAALPTPIKHALHMQGRLHPWLHLFGFTLVAFLLIASVRSTPARVVLVVSLILFGYGTEAAEAHGDGWPIERGDVRSDTEGVLLGAACATLLTRRMLTEQTVHHR